MASGGQDRGVSRLLRGALAGAAATVPMSFVMLAGDRLLPRQPPESITRAALDAAPVDVPEEAVRPLAVAAHLGFGA
ncbi:MAG: hypothetical protein JWM64_2480, partial [Frankiales bacterium]|nr:hypothetical protein [Frankiales bacterium]